MKSPILLLFLGGCLVLPERFLSAQEPANNAAPMPVPEESFSPSLTPILANQSAADPVPAGTPETTQSLFPRYPPGMFGDFLAIESVRQSVGGQVEALSGVAFRSAFKIADNESPRPLDRVFLTGNDFGNVNPLLLASHASSASVYREMIGFEKTFLQGDASVGMRLPFFQLTGAPGWNETRIGDVSVILKYAFVNNRATGHVFSGGLVVTAPTGQALRVAGQSAIHPVYLQPWLGDVLNWKNFFVQGFTSVAVPTDARDVTFLFKSIGAGYWLYRANEPNRLLSAIVPNAEFHLTEPLTHRGLNHLPVGAPILLDFTGGFYVFLRRAVLGVCVGTPLTGPKPYEYLVNTSLNFRF